MSDYARVARSTLWTYLFTYLAVPIAFLVRALYARKLTVVDYGIFFGLFAFFGLLFFLRDWGLNSASIFYANKYLVKKEYGKVKMIYWMNLGFQIATALVIVTILYAIKPLVLSFIFKGEGHVDFLFSFFAVYWVFEAVVNANLTFINIFQEQKVSKLFEFIAKVLVLVFSYVGFVALQPFQVPVLAYIAAFILVSLGMFWYIFSRHREKFSGRAERDAGVGREFFTYAMTAAFGSVMVILFINTDMFLIQVFLGAAQVGYYSTAYSIAEIVMMLANPLAIVMVPYFTRLWHEGDKARLSNLTNFLFNHLAVVILPVAVFIFLYASQIVYFVAGPSFADATPLLMVFCAAEILKVYTFMSGNVIASMGKVKRLTMILAITGIINVVGDLILIRLMGTLGAIIATIVALTVYFILAAHDLRRELHLRFRIGILAKTVAAAAVFGVIAFLLTPVVHVVDTGKTNWNVFANGVIIFAVAGIAYIALIFATGVVTREKIVTAKRLARIKAGPLDRWLGDKGGDL